MTTVTNALLAEPVAMARAGTEQDLKDLRAALKATASPLTCVPGLIAHSDAAVDLAHARLIRINELEAELAPYRHMVTPKIQVDAS